MTTFDRKEVRVWDNGTELRIYTVGQWACIVYNGDLSTATVVPAEDESPRWVRLGLVDGEVRASTWGTGSADLIELAGEVDNAIRAKRTFERIIAGEVS